MEIPSYNLVNYLVAFDYLALSNTSRTHIYNKWLKLRKSDKVKASYETSLALCAMHSSGPASVLICFNKA